MYKYRNIGNNTTVKYINLYKIFKILRRNGTWQQRRKQVADQNW